MKCLMLVLFWSVIKNLWNFVDYMDKEVWFRLNDGFLVVDVVMIY